MGLIRWSKRAPILSGSASAFILASQVSDVSHSLDLVQSLLGGIDGPFDGNAAPRARLLSSRVHAGLAVRAPIVGIAAGVGVSRGCGWDRRRNKREEHAGLVESEFLDLQRLPPVAFLVA